MLGMSDCDLSWIGGGKSSQDSSLDFARSILQQAHIPTSQSIFDFEKLKEKHVLELGYALH